MNSEEVQAVIQPILNAHGIEFRDVIPQLHEDSKRPVIKWHNNGKDIYVSPEFRTLTQEEIKFGALWTLVPKPVMKNRVGDAMQLGFALLFEVFLLLILFDAGTPSIFSIVVATLILLSFGQFIRSRHKDRQVAAHLDTIVAITEDPISARTFLEKAYGPLRPDSIWKTDLSLAEHPIMKYERQGTDERLKAILKSDLVHPLPEKSHP
jgi:hypothetical protein